MDDSPPPFRMTGDTLRSRWRGCRCKHQTTMSSTKILDAPMTATQQSALPAQPAALPNTRPDLQRILSIHTIARVLLGLFLVFAASRELPALADGFPLAFVPLIGALVTLGVVQSGYLRRRLGERHIGVSLVVSTMDVLLSTDFATQWFFNSYVIPLGLNTSPPALARWLQSLGVELGPNAPPIAPLILLVSLFVLLIVTCWRYPVKYALGYVATTTFVNVIVAVLFSATPTQLFTSLTIAVARTAIFTALALVITYLVRVQNQQQQALLDANTKLIKHVSTIEALAVSQERNRLARELHDTLAHTLSAASVQLEATQSLWDSDRPRAHGALTQALRTTRDGLTETRRALGALRASPLEDLGFELALKELGQTAAQRSGARVVVSVTPDLDLDAEIEQTLYRAAQEALDNCVRHANAKSINAAVDRRNGSLRLRVSDDGCGFDVTEARARSGHYGLNGMIERVESMGGAVRIVSTPGAGTQVEVEIRQNVNSRNVV
jgi:signal transduction histidine kinase